MNCGGFSRPPAPGKIRIGVVTRSGEMRLYERDRKTGELDVECYTKKCSAACSASAKKPCARKSISNTSAAWMRRTAKFAKAEREIAFLLEPTTIQQVADVAFSGGVMPQKSTDFYPKLLSGLTIYKLEH